VTEKRYLAISKYVIICSFQFSHRQLQEARTRVAHLFKQTNENVQVGCNDVIRNKHKLKQLYLKHRELHHNELQFLRVETTVCYIVLHRCVKVISSTDTI